MNPFDLPAKIGAGGSHLSLNNRLEQSQIMPMTWAVVPCPSLSQHVEWRALSKEILYKFVNGSNAQIQTPRSVSLDESISMVP